MLEVVEVSGKQVKSKAGKLRTFFRERIFGNKLLRSPIKDFFQRRYLTEEEKLARDAQRSIRKTPNWERIDGEPREFLTGSGWGIFVDGPVLVSRDAQEKITAIQFEQSGTKRALFLDPKNLYRPALDLTFDEKHKVSKILKYDGEGYPIKEVYPTKRRKSTRVVDLTWDGGYPYQETIVTKKGSTTKKL